MAKSAISPAQAQEQPLQPFREVADRANIPQASVLYRSGGTFSIDLMRTGYLFALHGIVSITFTTGATGTWANKTTGIPTPENAIREVRLKANTGYTFQKLSGFDLYLAQRVQKLYDYRNPAITFNSNAVASQIFNLPASYAANSTYTVKFPIYIKPVLGDKELLSLILLEGKGTIYFEVDWAVIETELLAMSGGATITVNNVDFVPEADVFLVPQVPHIPPQFSPVQSWISQQDGVTNTGYDKFLAPNGGSLLRVITYYVDGNGALLPPTAFGNYRMSFGGIMQPVSGRVANLFAQMQREYEGFNLPSGVIVQDFLGGNGDASRNPALRDTVPVRDVNDLSLDIEILNGTSLGAGAYRRVILQRLQKATPS